MTTLGSASSRLVILLLLLQLIFCGKVLLKELFFFRNQTSETASADFNMNMMISILSNMKGLGRASISLTHVLLKLVEKYIYTDV
jgi:hypothetical protein